MSATSPVTRPAVRVDNITDAYGPYFEVSVSDSELTPMYVDPVAGLVELAPDPQPRALNAGDLHAYIAQLQAALQVIERRGA